MKRSCLGPIAGLLVLAALAVACRRESAAAATPDSTDHRAMAGTHPTPDTADARGLRVSREERERLGIMMTTALLRPLTTEVRLVGRVVPAETAARTITSKVDGFVERLYVDFTGRDVRRGEPLFDLYSPMIVAAQQELLLAIHLRDGLGTAPNAEARANADSLVSATRRRLRYWDVDDAQIAEVERSGAVQRVVTFRAPITGTVMEKTVVQGQAITAGAPLLQLADLSVVWLEADVFESDLAAVRVGQPAEVAFDAYPGEPMRGRVTYVYPTVDPASRTGRVRVELPNRDNRVRPGLFGTVRIVTTLAARAVVIPRQAALVTGDRQLVFVEDTMGMLVPRLVTLGAETDSLVEVKSGLHAGERVVAAAAFLLDAESNLGAALAGMAGMDMRGQGSAKQPAQPAPVHQHQVP